MEYIGHLYQTHSVKTAHRTEVCAGDVEVTKAQALVVLGNGFIKVVQSSSARPPIVVNVITKQH